MVEHLPVDKGGGRISYFVFLVDAAFALSIKLFFISTNELSPSALPFLSCIPLWGKWLHGAYLPNSDDPQQLHTFDGHSNKTKIK